ncbi:MAG: YigZ family protein [Clostridia bacterium]|nr:YigZ family protein [Clostridia bacterium]
MSSLVTLSDYSGELTIKKSRFISFSYAISSEEDALNKLTALRKKYWDSTHICYAYVADESGLTIKSSDDGEPSGTAGAPILSILTASGYKKSMIAVVRYFGGTKLGVGGLVKAYSDSAKLVAEACVKKHYEYCSIISIEVDYNQYKKIQSALSEEAKVLDSEYLDNVKLEVAIKKDSFLLDKLISLTAGKIMTNKKSESYIEF